MSLNSELFLTIHYFSGQNILLDQFIIFGAVVVIYLMFALSFVAFFWGGSKEKKALILSLASIVFSLFLIEIIHLFINVPRPFMAFNFNPLIFHAGNFSFPSTHTTVSACIALSFTFCKSKLAPIFWILTIWVGFARIFVGVHYPLDILGGLLIGFISVFLSSKLLNKFLHL